ncbi:MAG: N-acetylmuramoyl-L-alanine amidase [Campylobacterales bacterium]
MVRSLSLLFLVILALWGAQPAVIRSLEVENGGLTVTFDGIVKPSQVKAAVLKGKEGQTTLFRYLFDFPAIYPKLKRQLNLPGFKSVYAAQFNPTTTRIVFYSFSPRTITPTGDGRRLRFAPVGEVAPSIGKIISDVALMQEIEATKPVFAPVRAQRKRVVIDAGHGGKDSGAIGYKGFMEKEIVLKIALMVERELRQDGYDILLTRSEDKFVELKERTRFANSQMGDLFISIHANASPTSLTLRGVETYFLSPARSERAKRVAQLENGPDFEVMDDATVNSFLNFLNREKIVASNKLAIDIQRSLLGSLRTKYDDVIDNGVREAPFWVLVGATMPAVLIEIGYVTNPAEAERLVNPVYQELIAKGIANGVRSYFEHN